MEIQTKKLETNTISKIIDIICRIPFTYNGDEE